MNRATVVLATLALASLLAGEVPAFGTLALVSCVATTAAAQGEVYVVDTKASSVRVHLGKAGLLGFLGHGHAIEAPISEGWIDVKPGNPGASRVDLRWEAAALAVVPGTEPAEDIPEVEERMRGPEVLDAAAHAEIRVWSFDVRVEDSDPEAGRWHLHVKAGLELKGDRHTIELPLEVRRDGDTLVTTGEAKLRLSQLGVPPPSVAGMVKVSDEFRVSFEIHARHRTTGSSGRESLPGVTRLQSEGRRSGGRADSTGRTLRRTPVAGAPPPCAPSGEGAPRAGPGRQGSSSWATARGSR